MEVGWLPRTHGSSLFARGETQAMVTVTLGTSRDEQTVDELMNYYSKKFMLHYNFPPFSVGEARRIAGPGRREMGHGALAEKSLEAVLPDPEQFPYTIRVVSDILESNGSSSMASVCGGSICLMDAGVPISGQVAGISVGIVEDNGKWELLTDILGEEDHFGDMDFKVAGTKDGVTGVQLDLKKRGLSQEQIAESMKRARTALTFILGKMNAIIDKPRAEISTLAPRILMVKVNPEKIGKIIGPAGKGIRALEADTGAKIDIEDDGTVYISCNDYKGAERAKAAVEAIAEDVQVGRIYDGKIISIKDFGAFVELAPGQDGLCHISELDDTYVKNVNDVVQIGQRLRVKVINVDDQGRVKLSRKAVLRDEAEGKES
jgi:polyribonucleotide nucleotidyltransferase